jgi:hypothetical protein
MIDNEVKSSEIMRKYNLKNRSNLSNIKKEREKIVALYEKKCV